MNLVELLHCLDNYKVVFFLSVAIVLNSCKSPDLYCKNEQKMLAAHDSLPVLELDFNLPTEILEKQVREKGYAEKKGLPILFLFEHEGLMLKASIHSRSSFQATCYGLPAMQHKSPQLELLVNKEGRVMAEGRHSMRLNSISGFISWYYPHDYPFGEKVVKLVCDQGLPADSVHKGISEITEGYLKYYRKRAYQLFEEPLCDLDSAQLTQVGKDYPFELRLWFGDDEAPFLKENSEPVLAFY